MVILTPASAISPWVTYEWSYAMGMDIPVLPLKFMGINLNSVHGKLKERMFGDWLIEGDDLFSKLGDQLIETLEDYPKLRAANLLSIAQNPARTREQRRDALQGLGDCGVKDVANELLDMLRDPANSDLRVSIAFSLGHLGNKIVVKDLIELAESRDETVNHVATAALGLLGDESVGPKLHEYLKSSDNWIRAMASEGLGKLEYLDACTDLSDLVINDLDWFVRGRAAEALGKLRDDCGVDALIYALDDSNVSVRADAAEALGMIANPKAVPALIESLNDYEFYYGNSRVCDRAADALAVIRDEKGRRAAYLWKSKQKRRKDGRGKR